MLRRSLFPAGVLLVIGLAACNGGTPNTNPTPGPTCIPNVTTQLVYPAPGATKVPATISEIVVAVSSPLPSSPTQFNLYLYNVANTNNSSYTANALSAIPASQLPAGSAPTTIPNPTYEAVGLVNSLYANFSPGTQLQTAINNATNNCTPQNIPGGTFTLQ